MKWKINVTLGIKSDPIDSFGVSYLLNGWTSFYFFGELKSNEIDSVLS